MPKVYETKTVEQKRLVEVQCDICKRVAKFGQWGKTTFDTERVEVSHRSGEDYPEGGSGEEIEFDLCPSCFREKLVPFLREQGAKAEYQPYDW